MTDTVTGPIQVSTDPFRWEGIEVMPYKEDGGTHFKDITRQTLFKGQHDLNVELRYFEIGEGGHSTLEFHQHSHYVIIVRGQGQVFVRDLIFGIKPMDTVAIAPETWHQFRANQGEPLGFLCLVHPERDRPQRPTPDHLDALRAIPGVGDFIRI